MKSLFDKISDMHHGHKLTSFFSIGELGFLGFSRGWQGKCGGRNHGVTVYFLGA
jgi:hypothetical protein